MDEHARMAGGALQFMQRAQMTGADADGYMTVRNWLTMIANGVLVVRQPDVLTPVKIPVDPPPAAPDTEAAAAA